MINHFSIKVYYRTCKGKPHSRIITKVSDISTSDTLLNVKHNGVYSCFFLKDVLAIEFDFTAIQYLNDKDTELFNLNLDELGVLEL